MTRMPVRMLCCAVAASCALVALGGCGRNDPSALIASAKGYIAKSDYKSATIQLKSALQQAPDNAEGRALLARSLLATGDAAGAQTEVRKALELKYSPDDGYPLLARALIAQNEFQKVVAELGNRTLTAPQARTDLGTSLALAYMALGDRAKAQSTLDAALAQTPSDARALTLAAKFAALRKDLADALKNVDAALAASPNDAEALTVKAALLSSQGKADDALKTLERAVDADANANAVSVRLELISMLIKSGQTEKAAAQLQAMQKVAPRDIRTAYADAIVAFARGDAKRAREAAQTVLGTKPDHLPSVYLSGLADLRLGSVAAAEGELRRVVAQAPNDVTARRWLATAYLQMGQSARAIETLEPVLVRGSNDPGALRVAGEAYLASGDPAKAGRYYEQANAIDKGNVPSEVRLAQVRLAAGDSAQAFKDLEALSKAEPSRYDADLAIITAHLRRGEFDQALAAANELQKKQPGNALVYNVKGTVYAAKHDFKSARENFEKALQIQPGYFAAVRNLALLDIGERKPEDARKRYEELLAKDPKNEQLLLAYAEVLASTGQPPDQVKAAIDKAITAAPTSVPARVALVTYSLRRGDTKAALAAAQSAQGAMPDDVRILDALGTTQLAAGETNQAIATFQRLVQLQPQQAGPLLRLADAQLKAKDYPGAIDSLHKAIALKPDLSQAWVGLAKAYLVSGSPADAIAEARKLQKDQPKRAIGFAIEAEVLASQKKWPQAATAYRDALAREPIPALAIRRYESLEAAGAKTEATHMAERWFEDQPKDIALRMFLALQSQLRKDNAGAIAQYRAALAVEPDNAAVLNNLALVLSESGDPKGAEYAERAYQLFPYNPDIMDTLGWILVQEKKDAARGTELLRTAGNLAPMNYQIRLHFAKALIQAGDKAGARRELETLAAVDKSSPVRADAEKLLSGL